MLIAMAVYDTKENNRMWMTRMTLGSLSRTVDWSKHRLVVVDNGSHVGTQDLLDEWVGRGWLRFTLIRNSANAGTARAINQAWKMREPGEHCVKMDNDVVVHAEGWVDEMEEVFARQPKVGIVGLKRKDLEECPWHFNEHYRSRLEMLPHEKGQSWIVVERVNHVMGTCQAYNSALLDKIGYLDQGSSLYGFDDSLSSVRAHVAGFQTVFLPHIEIDHVDPGGTEFIKWKQEVAQENLGPYQQAVKDYRSGKRPLYCPPEGRAW